MQILPKWLRPTLLWTAAAWISGAGSPLFAASSASAATATSAASPAAATSSSVATAATAASASTSAVTAAAALSTAAATPFADSLAEPLAETPDSTVVLRFDEARREELEAPATSSLPAGADTTSRIVCKVNRRRVPFLKAYDAVTLWNVKRVKVRHRRKRLTDTTRREEVKLLKFFIERNRRKGQRPHLEGNVAGYNWSSSEIEGTQRLHIDTYTLRHDYDSVRLAGGDLTQFSRPSAMWHELSPRAHYVLNGQEVAPKVFQFIDGLILRTLDIDDPTLRDVTSASSAAAATSVPSPTATSTAAAAATSVPSPTATSTAAAAATSVPSPAATSTAATAATSVPSPAATSTAATAATSVPSPAATSTAATSSVTPAPAAMSEVPVVRGTTYPDRTPLVFFCGVPSSIEAWLAMGLSGAFQSEAEVEMNYYYMLPTEAVQLFGERGLYGAICIDVVR